MVKTKVRLIVSLIVVCMITMFLWLGKTPFAGPEKVDPYPSPPQTVLPDDSEPVESPDEANAPDETNTPDETETPDDPAPAESPDEPAETDSIPPESPTDVLPVFTGPLELPVEGSTGWAAVSMTLYSEANTGSSVVTGFNAGQVFVIKKEFGDWWYVESDNGKTGWVEHRSCFINLPDVIPSIVYNITNAYSALTRSSGYEIPGITGQKLYDAHSYNPRLQRDEFIVPALYSTSKLLCAAQQLALEAGDTIIIYEAYRARASQQRSVTRLRELMSSNEKVRSAIEDGPWSIDWFIATSLSNHQRGVAFDTSLGTDLTREVIQAGEVSFTNTVEYEEYAMPTTMHELSPLAATFTRPVSSRSRDAWRDAKLTDTMTPGAIRLQGYFDKAGFTPLASEWWHFNDLGGVTVANELGIKGSFFVGDILSLGGSV